MDEIGYADDETINRLIIKKGRGAANDPVAFKFEKKKIEDVKDKKIEAAKIAAIRQIIGENGMTEEFIKWLLKVDKLEDITEEKHLWLIGNIEKAKGFYKGWKAKAS